MVQGKWYVNCKFSDSIEGGSIPTAGQIQNVHPDNVQMKFSIDIFFINV